MYYTEKVAHIDICHSIHKWFLKTRKSAATQEKKNYFGFVSFAQSRGLEGRKIKQTIVPQANRIQSVLR